jgi:hypothetical protein
MVFTYSLVCVLCVMSEGAKWWSVSVSVREGRWPATFLILHGELDDLSESPYRSGVLSGPPLSLDSDRPIYLFPRPSTPLLLYVLYMCKHLNIVRYVIYKNTHVIWKYLTTTWLQKRTALSCRQRECPFTTNNSIQTWDWNIFMNSSMGLTPRTDWLT